jgi:hypothetical protein
VGILEPWAPIVALAVVALVTGALVCIVLPWHRSDFSRAPHAAALRDAKPGSYVVQHSTAAAALRSEEIQRKSTDGPRA